MAKPRTRGMQVPLTPRLLAALFVGSLFVSFLATHLARADQINNSRATQAERVRSVASSLAGRVAPLLESGDDLRLAMMGASAAQFGNYRVMLIDLEGRVRMDTGVGMGGQVVELKSRDGALTESIDDTFAEHMAPALAVSGVVGEVRIRYPRVPRTAAASFSWNVFGGSLLACLSLIAMAGAICHHWMRHLCEAVTTAQGMAHGDLSARCERPAAGVIRDLQDGLHDMAGALGQGVQQVQQSFLELSFRSVEVLESRAAPGHGERTCTFSMLLASRLGLTPDECRDLDTAARLHDLGEVFEPPLHGTHSLDAGHVERMRRVPQRGAELLEGISSMRRVAEFVRHHRERFDGKGFPHGLRGDRIPLGARILGIADAFDQLTTVCSSDGKPLSWPNALDVLRLDRGETFDPWLVDLFEEEVRKTPEVVEDASTVMISTSGVVPYKAIQLNRQQELLEETSMDWDEEWENSELEVEQDEFLHLEEQIDDWLSEDLGEDQSGSAGDLPAVGEGGAR